MLPPSFFFAAAAVVCKSAVAAATVESAIIPAANAPPRQQSPPSTYASLEAEVTTLRLRHEGKMGTLRELRDALRRRRRQSAPSASAASNAPRSDVEHVAAKYDELRRRTNIVREYVLGHNRIALLRSTDAVRARVEKRRDRYRGADRAADGDDVTNGGTKKSDATNDRYLTKYELLTMLPSSSAVADAAMLDEDYNNNDNNDDDDLVLANNITTDYDSIATTKANIESRLLLPLLQKEDAMLNSRLRSIDAKYQNYHNMTIIALEENEEKKKKKKKRQKCVSMTDGVRLVSRELLLRQDDDGGNMGGEGLFDYAEYGKVVYGMTSLPYVPSPRHSFSSSSSSSSSNHDDDDDDDDDEYDTMIENTFWQQQQQQQQQQLDNDADDSSGMINHILRNLQYEEVYNVLYKYTTQYKLSTIRPYLPMDWERMLDYYFTSSSSSWSERTIYSLLDNVIPDYMFHAWGVPYGKTAHPHVSLVGSSGGHGNGKEVEEGGEGEGRTRRRSSSSPSMGRCYPLSMSTTTDPVYDMPTTTTTTFATPRHNDERDDDVDDYDDANKMGSSYGRPRYTVELPYSIYIDAVTLEHRSFPIDHTKKKKEEHNYIGGESAPRFVRVVGYPPCPEHDQDEMNEEVGSRHSCASSSRYEFDISSPINLGLLEYQRITTGTDESEDDYDGNTSSSTRSRKINVIIENDRYKTTARTKDEELVSSSVVDGSRHRSIQTFAVKGGLWKPRLLEDDVFSFSSVDNDGIATQVKNKEKEELVEVINDDNDENLEIVSPGQCTPPKDEDSLPSCGDNNNDISHKNESGRSSNSNRRRIVKAVSFIVEENWGNADYTCLYQVRVHGDIVV